MRDLACILVAFVLCCSNALVLERHRLRRSAIQSAILPPFYHTSEQIRDLLQHLSVECKGARLNTLSATNGVIDAVEILPQSAGGMHMHHARHTSAEQEVEDLSASASDFRPTVMLVFGEHPRELISVESGLNLAQTLCGGGSDAQAALQKANYRLVVNANPDGRALVEGGDHCLRDNANGVDLNRNFAEGWDGEVYSDPQAQPGAKPFSEAASSAIRDLIGDGNTNSYVSVHSGGEFLLYPYGHSVNTSSGEPVPDQDKMTGVLKRLGDKYCSNCQVGTIGQLLGYSASGVDMDYAFASGVPLSFTFEIYGKVSLPQVQSKSTTSFLSGAQEVDEDSKCFTDFNPDTKEEYDELLSRWTSAYLDLSSDLSRS